MIEPTLVMLHKQLREAFKSPRDFWRALREYTAGTRRRTRITDIDGLAEFLDTRASHVAQTALYGYLRTRAGARYPELFANDDFMISVNRAKWRMWLACLSDLAVFSGGLLANRTGKEVSGLMTGVCEAILARTGVPEDAGEAFEEHAAGLRARIAATDFFAVGDDESAFTVSPDALVESAPVIEKLRELDGEIVRNSVRFRWQEVRRDLRRGLDADAVLAGAAAGSQTAPTSAGPAAPGAL
jgi:hypothetical protein